MTIEDNDLGIIILCALRYSLGRRSYITGVMQYFIRKHWSELDNHTRENIKKELKRYLEDDISDPTDIYESWLALKKTIEV